MTLPSDRAEDVRGLRSLADSGELYELCAHRACRRARRCCGPRGASRYLAEAVLPACIARALDEMYEPVARFDAFLDRMFAIEDNLRERGLLPD